MITETFLHSRFLEPVKVKWKKRDFDDNEDWTKKAKTPGGDGGNQSPCKHAPCVTECYLTFDPIREI